MKQWHRVLSRSPPFHPPQNACGLRPLIGFFAFFLAGLALGALGAFAALLARLHVPLVAARFLQDAGILHLPFQAADCTIQ